jgi:ubiquinol-cytochrome c reductase iron-sulfur subunit
MEKEQPQQNIEEQSEHSTRRDFMVMSASAVACVGAAAVSVPFIKSLAPDQGVLAVGSTEVNITNIKPGETVTVTWRGQPVFIRHRTEEEIKAANAVNITELRDPQPDAERVKPGKEQWLVTVGICTHLGCVPLTNQGDFHGWFCPCHGSAYDTSGRIRKGPAPLNLPIPPYEFINDTTIKIG